jgi:hypothetical protein
MLAINESGEGGRGEGGQRRRTTQLGTHIVAPWLNCDAMRSPTAELQCECPSLVEKLGGERQRRGRGDVTDIYCCAVFHWQSVG